MNVNCGAGRAAGESPIGKPRGIPCGARKGQQEYVDVPLFHSERQRVPKNTFETSLKPLLRTMFFSPVTESASTRAQAKLEANFSVTLCDGHKELLTCRRENNGSP